MDDTTPPAHAGHLRGFLAGLVAASLVAVVAVTVSGDPGAAPAPVSVPTRVEQPAPAAPQTDTPVKLPFERISATTLLDSCARRAVAAAPPVTPPAGAATLATANFPPDVGFGPLSVHLPLPGSAYVHVLRSTTPLPATGAVDPYAAPLVVDVELSRPLGAETVAVGISAPFRAAFPPGWLPRFADLLLGCLTSAGNPSTAPLSN
jgi:hypothetical protein